MSGMSGEHSNPIDGTLVNVDNECSALCADIEAMRKKMRINNELIATVEKRIEEEDQLKRAADKDIEFFLTQIDKLEKEIEQKKVDIECLKTSCQQTDDTINDLIVELDSKDAETEQQQTIFEEMKQTYVSEFEALKQSYVDEPVFHCFDTTIGDQIGEHLRSSQTTDTTVNITTDLLAEDLQNRGDMRCSAITEEVVDTNTTTVVTKVDEIIEKEEHKQTDDNIESNENTEVMESDVELKSTDQQSSDEVSGEQRIEQMIAEKQLSQTIDSNKAVIIENSGDTQQSEVMPQTSSGDGFGPMFANLFRKKPTAAHEDITAGFKFKLSMSDSADNSSISSSPEDQKQTTTSFKLWLHVNILGLQDSNTQTTVAVTDDWKIFHQEVQSTINQFESSANYYIDQTQRNHTNEYINELQAEVQTQISLIDRLLNRVQTHSLSANITETQVLFINESISVLYVLRNEFELLHEKFGSLGPANDWTTFHRDTQLAIHHLNASTNHLSNELSKTHTLQQLQSIRAELVMDIEHTSDLIISLETALNGSLLTVSQRTFINDSIESLYSLRNTLELLEEILSTRLPIDEWSNFRRDIELAVNHVNASTDYLLTEAMNPNITAAQTEQIRTDVIRDIQHIDYLLNEVEVELNRTSHTESERLFINQTTDTLYHLRNTLQLLEESLVKNSAGNNWNLFYEEIILTINHLNASTHYILVEIQANHTTQQLNDIRAEVSGGIVRADIILEKLESSDQTLNASQKQFIEQSIDSIILLRNDLELLEEVLNSTHAQNDWTTFNRSIQLAINHLNASTDYLSNRLANITVEQLEAIRAEVEVDIEHVNHLIKEVEDQLKTGLNINDSEKSFLENSIRDLNGIRTQLMALHKQIENNGS